MRWEKKCPLRTQLPISASVVGRYHIVVGGDVGIDRLMPDLKDAPDAATNGHGPAVIVISLPLGGDERAVVKYQPLGRLWLRKGCNVIAFTSARFSSPAKDQTLRIKKLVVMCSALLDRKTTKSGPTDHFSVPSSSSVAVGN